MSGLRAGSRGASRAALGAALGLLAVTLPTLPTAAQSRLPQDELDLQVRSSVVQGSGARAFGMGGAFLARADDATAASWNPAGLSYLRRPEVSAVWSRATLVSRERDFSTAALLKRDVRAGQWPDFISGAWPFEYGSVRGAGQISYQRVVSFTNTRTIEEEGKRIEASTRGGFDVLAFGTGLQVSRRLRLGAAYNHWFNGYDQSLSRNTPFVNSRQAVGFELSGWNLHFGLLWSPNEKLNLGAAAKTSFAGRVRLKRNRVDFGDATLETTDTSNAFARDDVRLNLPGAVGVGLSWRAQNTLTLSLDYTRTFWSDSHIDNFFTLARCPSLPADCAPRLDQDFFPRLPYPTLNDPNQSDTEELRAGVEQVVFLGRVKWPLRVGGFANKQYFNQALAPGPPSFSGVTGGTGLILGSMLLDVAYVLEWGRYSLLDTEEGARPSIVTVRSHRVYVSAIYRFGSRR